MKQGSKHIKIPEKEPKLFTVEKVLKKRIRNGKTKTEELKEPDFIIGGTLLKSKKVVLLVKWEDNKIDLVSYDFVKKKWPIKLIEYFEKHLELIES
ncbi:CLUMA_CG001176, isoform A [Clunio marinus]|uniref:CLUMA_CG001176, isoform A n=1 Tax=Clunio marinus TaxID=568069 RepID=A0A1J1HLP0_9DIPT|nr:CLUMA_CG001176, isoform A [Clunio marinus]